MKIAVKRIYDQQDPEDGIRILVDRLWPRGMSKEGAKVDLWVKTVAPSNDLRKWYRHDPQKWDEFKRRYFAELKANSTAVNELIDHMKDNMVTFLYSSKEPNCNNAVALREYISRLPDKSDD